MSLSNTTKIKGLYTYGNEITQVDGSLEVADNVNIDEPSVIMPRRGFEDLGSPLPSGNSRFHQIMSYKKTPIRHDGQSLEWLNGSNFSQFSGVYEQLDESIRLKYVEANSNLYFTSKNGIMKISATNVSEFSTEPNYITKAGVPKAVDLTAITKIDPTGFLPPQSKVAYKVLFGRKDVNNNLQLGTPTSRFVVTNNSKNVINFEKTYLEFKENENYISQKTTLICGKVNNTLETTSGDSSYVLISNAWNKKTYGLYFNKGTATIPPLSGVEWIEVNLVGMSSGDHVAPKVQSSIINHGNLQGIGVALVGNDDIIFTNTSAGVTNGVRTPNGTPSTDIGGGWDIVVNTVGNNPKYVSKYFFVFNSSKKVCFYYGNPETISTVPTDPSTAGAVFKSILIENNSTKSYIANVTANAIIEELGTTYDVELSVISANPYIAMVSTEEGDIRDSNQGSINPSDMEVSVINQGSVIDGNKANVDVTFTIPLGIDETFFFRIYRTGYLSSYELGIPLEDIDVGEECFLVYEGPVVGSVGSKITVLDITPETFRQSGEPLYNNPSSGDGTSKNNDVPPISVDICNYKGYTFYANTQYYQTSNLDVLSVDSIVSEVSEFIVGSKDLLRTYKFRGKETISKITCSTKVNTKSYSLANPDAYFTLYSASDLTKYIVYFDDGTAISPNDPDSVIVRVNIADLDPTDSVVEPLSLILRQISDFENIQVVGNEIVFENSENGFSTTNSTPNGTPSTDIGTGWDIEELQKGEGEDISLGYILISKSSSVSLKIERTTRSIVNVINGDTNSVVYARYNSGQNDLPGKLIFESKDIASSEFYIASNSMNGTDFVPEIPSIISGTIVDIQSSSSTTSLIQINNHGFKDGESVYFYIPNVVPSIQNSYSIKVIDVDTIEINATYISGDVLNSFYFFPFYKSNNLMNKNRLMWSKKSIPEAVPLLNFVDVGTRDEPIERILSVRDFLYIFKTDGIFMLSGDEDRYFLVKQIDTEKIVCPDSAAVLNNQIYILTNNSVLTIGESSPTIISRMIENKITSVVRKDIDYRKLGFGVAYEDDRAYIIWLPSSPKDQVATQCYRYNIIERTWTRWTKSATCAVVIGDDSKLYIGDGDRPYTMVERKNRDRTDHADRNFLVFLNVDAINNDKYRLSDVSEIEIGDAITQTQTINIEQYNRLLKKLDIDQGFTFDTFYEDYKCSVGDNIASSLNSLNLFLESLDTSGTITYHSFDNTKWIEMRDKFNLLMDQLNNVNCITQFKDYVKITRDTQFEYIITDIDAVNSEVKLNTPSEIIQGELQVYKHIKSKFRFNPLHFGNPSSLKQINYGYVLYDQNNFYSMKLEYKTDLSPSFEGGTFRGKGVGFWGSDQWGFPKVKNYWGGEGSDAPKRTIIPRNKQRCRYITPQCSHSTARDFYRIVGVAHEIREISNKAYRGL